jgi:hypothetical protein
VSGEGGRPFGFDRYSKAFYVAWRYKHRKALGDPAATLRGLAAKEGVSGRFAEHIWDVVNRAGTGYPSRLTIERWQQLAAPSSDAQASVARVRGECDAIVKELVAWPSWLFARGDLAAGGAGDESPLVFDDTTLAAAPAHEYVYPVEPSLRRGGHQESSRAHGPYSSRSRPSTHPPVALPWSSGATRASFCERLLRFPRLTSRQRSRSAASPGRSRRSCRCGRCSG